MRTPTKVLLVDDDDLFLKSIRKELDRAGYSVRTATNGKDALAELRSFPPDVVLLDVRLQGESGLTILRTMKDRDPSVEIIMLTGFGSIDTAVDSLRSGAFHYLVKPAKLSEIEALIQKAHERRHLKIENRALKLQVGQSDRDIIVGQSDKMNELMRLVERVAPSEETVLIQGESGSGKELIARRLHRLSSRRGRPFVVVDCASLNKSLLETELFGHERGAFTGATGVKHGLMEAAHTGTLFMDEVGCLEMGMQSDFLRVLERREYRRVGSTSIRKTDVRVVAATNIDLAEAVREGKFREDLFFRLSVIVLQVPSLRERSEDIPPLVDHFLDRTRCSVERKKLSREALQCLKDYRWPGNVRELRNVLERAVLLSDGVEICPADLRMMPSSADRLVERLAEGQELPPMREIQKRYIRLVLNKVQGHQQKAAEILGVDPKTIYRSLKKGF